MEVYIDLVAILNFAVDFLLLLGTNRLCGYPPGWRRTVMAAAVGGLYAGACLVTSLYFLRNMLWRIVIFCLIGWIAFGWSKSALRRSVVFFLLSMALGGIALGFGSTNLWSLVLAAAALCVMCAIGFQGRIGAAAYVPVELSYMGKSLRLTAMQDTGNMLRDPMTGRPVLVVGADVAKNLTGLTKEQLLSPIETVTAGFLPGLRLIPYKALGQSSGMLLALRMQDVRIGSWKGSSLVAFAPEVLGSEGGYQALTGGMM